MPALAYTAQPVDGADFIIPVKIEDTVHKVYVLKRPGVDEFMLRMSERYEIVIFTASLSLVSWMPVFCLSTLLRLAAKVD